MPQEALFACSRCFTKHPFEELSQGQQVCRECRGSFPVVKCTYCRSEFQQESKNSTSAICKKCEHNVKQYGLPSKCGYCSILAAFIGNKCQRCVHSERKYGPPQICHQCKQRCAFDKDEDKTKKSDIKLLCWLCLLSYRRALEKSKQTDVLRHSHVAKISARRDSPSKRPHHRVDVTKHPPPAISSEEGPATKQSKLSSTKFKLSAAAEDPTSDHMIQIAGLKEEIARLSKQVAQLNATILEKDKLNTELKADLHTKEQEFRRKFKDQSSNHAKMVEEMSRKIKELQSRNAALSKQSGMRKAAKVAAASGPAPPSALESVAVSATNDSASNSPLI